MFRRVVGRAVLDTRYPPSTLPPAFLLPRQARYFNSTAPIVEGESGPEHLPTTHEKPLTSLNKPDVVSSTTNTTSLSSATPDLEEPSHQIRDEGSTIHPSIKELLPLLRAQPSHYITVHIHARSYLLTVGDVLHLPFHMPDVVPGDILRFNRASVLGSRDYTLKGAPYIDERLFECRARVMGIESEPMRSKEKKKQRTRKTKTVRSKHRYTVLRLADLKINGVEEIEGQTFGR